MKLLAIETATEACSVALAIDGEIVERHEVAPRMHAQRLLPMIEEVLAAASVSKRQLDLLAVGRGPGAFTGVRLAISIAQGMALGLDRPVVPVSTLAALSLQARGDVATAIDARMGEVYFAHYRDGRLMGEELIGRAGEFPRLPIPFAAVGTGWATYGEALTASVGIPATVDGSALPHAADIARLALRSLDHAVDAAHLEPVYLRNKVAQTLLEQGKTKPARVDFG